LEKVFGVIIEGLIKCCLWDSKSFYLRALTIDHLLCGVVEMKPEVYDISCTHEAKKIPLDASDLKTWAHG